MKMHGLGLERERVRCDLQLRIKGGSEGIKIFCKGRTIEDAVHESVLSLFNNKMIFIYSI